jgi:hypothetical protein
MEYFVYVPDTGARSCSTGVLSYCSKRSVCNNTRVSGALFWSGARREKTGVVRQYNGPRNDLNHWDFSPKASIKELEDGRLGL